jgi:hypothetical protein
METKSLRFKDKRIFGNSFDAYRTKAYGHVMYLLLSGKIDKDGTVHSGSLAQLWSYIYVLYLENKHHGVFDAMRGRRGPLQSKGTAKRFIRTVLAHTGAEKTSEPVLIRFINQVIKQDSIKNPVIALVTGAKPCSSTGMSRSTNKLHKEFSSNKNSKILIENKLRARKDSPSVAAQLREKMALLKDKINKKIEVINEEGRNKHEFIEEIVRATGARSPNQIIGRTQAMGDRVRYLEEENKSIVRLFAKELDIKSNNINDIIDALRKKLTTKSAKKSAKRGCTAELAAFKKDLENTVNLVIMGRMCVIKKIGDILGLATADTMCDAVDISKQKDAFMALPAKKKAEYKAIYAENITEITHLRDKFIGLAGITPTCEELDAFERSVVSDKQRLGELINMLTNMNEDLLGSCRVFVRMRPFINALDDAEAAKQVDSKLDGTRASITCGGASHSGTFFGTYDQKYNNAEMFAGQLGVKPRGLQIDVDNERSLKNTFEQLKAGYSIAMLTIGFSGSGKSAMFFGRPSEPGLVQLGLANLGISDVSIQYVFELYYDYINVNERTVRGKVIIGYDKPRDLEKRLRKFGVANTEFDPISIAQDTMGGDVAGFINTTMKTITDHQRATGRIKRTINNDSSSRSHLFVVLKVGGSYLTISDCAGCENSYNIYTSLFNGVKKMTLPYFMLQFNEEGKYRAQLKGEKIENYMQGFGITNGSDELKKNSVGELKFKGNTQPRIENTLAKNVQVLLEGFYITETLLHMQYFFNVRNGKKPKMQTQEFSAGNIVYRTDRVFVQPEQEMQGEHKKQINMIPVLNFIDSLGAGNTVSKFLLFGALRPDKCAENLDSLRYLSSVASTT